MASEVILTKIVPKEHDYTILQYRGEGQYSTISRETKSSKNNRTTMAYASYSNTLLRQ